MKEIIINNIEEIDKKANEFIELTGDYKKYAFYGKMGSGKTTFIKAICKNLGIDENVVNSPTFTIINEYIGKNDLKVYHIDLYRIKVIEELYNIGIEEYLYSDEAYVFIEWPEIIENILDNNTLRIKIEEITEGVRKISWKYLF